MKLHIDGGLPLFGTLAVDSSKNALLPIIASTILTDGVTVLKNVPRISDIENLLKILVSLDIKARFKNGDLEIDTRNIKFNSVSPEIAGKIRGSIFVLGAIVGRFGQSSVPYPGGCAIGSRPIDLHLQALRDLGINVTEQNDVITCKRKNIKTSNTTTEVFLDFPSVGATENLIMASVIGNKRVRIINAALEPEVEDLCNFLKSCGAVICGQGTSTIVIQGVKALTATTYTAIPDRINTGSYLIAVAACGGEVTLTNTIPHHNANLIAKLQKVGCEIKVDGGNIKIKSPIKNSCHKESKSNLGFLKSLGCVHTAPYPGFATDIQSQLAVLQCKSRGLTTITENLFENRFKYAGELGKLGAKVCVKSKSITITGVKQLVASSDENSPTVLVASDLRGGVSLVLAAICADGKSVIHNAEYIYRGHQDIEKDLVSLGANIIREDG